MKTVLTEGKKHILSLLAKEILGAEKGCTHIAIGNGTPTSTGLGNEVGRRAIYDATPDAPDTEKKFLAQFEAEYPSTDYNVSEVGLLADAVITVGGEGKWMAVATVSPTVFKRANLDTFFITYRLYY